MQRYFDLLLSSFVICAPLLVISDAGAADELRELEQVNEPMLCIFGAIDVEDVLSPIASAPGSVRLDMRGLVLEEAVLTTAAAKQVRAFQGLRQLSVIACDVQPNCIAYIATLPELAVLDLSGSTISDSDLDILSNTASLRRLSLYDIRKGERSFDISISTDALKRFRTKRSDVLIEGRE